MTKWISQPPSAVICLLSSLCTALLFIIIILLVTITRQGVDQTEQSMEVKLRNLSEGVQLRVEGLSHHGSMILKKLTAMETFVKEFKKCEVMSKVSGIEDSMKNIVSDKVTGSLSNDQQRILEALGDLADEIWKGNSSTYALCGKNWVLHDSSCYFLFRKVQTWDRAKKNCEDRKSHLVVINSDDEMNFLRQFSLSLTLWIGLTDKEGSWQWVDKTPYEKTPKFWNIGQPDDWYGHGKGGGEDCGQLVDGDGWNDNYCSYKFAYICEKTLSS